jgi:methylphosphotriester-DNA--protein-cysteine methyltransferase
MGSGADALTRAASRFVAGDHQVFCGKGRAVVMETGLKLTQYLQHLRVGKARDMLELSALTVDEIAWRVGYKDPSAFRKMFQRVVGLSPGEYRRRFAVTGPPSPRS